VFQVGVFKSYELSIETGKIEIAITGLPQAGQRQKLSKVREKSGNNILRQGKLK